MVFPFHRAHAMFIWTRISKDYSHYYRTKSANLYLPILSDITPFLIFLLQVEKGKWLEIICILSKFYWLKCNLRDEAVFQDFKNCYHTILTDLISQNLVHWLMITQLNDYQLCLVFLSFITIKKLLWRVCRNSHSNVFKETCCLWKEEKGTH